MSEIRLAPDFSLPLDAATRRLAILAMSGAGKSNVAVVMAEQMFAAGIPWVAIDPKGDWWGVRSNKSGKDAGLPIPIFGGLHGDIPLEPSAGKLVAEMIIEQRLTCVLDISEFAERQQQWGFLIDLGETLLRKNRQVLHLFLEEADEYLPQRTSEKGNLPKCLGVWQRVVKRGRFRGIGSTQITQRNASLNKDTLYMAEALIAMRVGGKADREAVRGWVDYHNASKEIVDSLPTLADGEGWVSSPAWLKLTQRVQFDRRHTFDSGSTPVLLKGTVAPATLANIDMETLRTRMAATIEKVKADDPNELRKQIAQLKKQIATTPTKTVEKADADPRAIERAVNQATGTVLREANKRIDALRTAGARVAKAVRDASVDLQGIADRYSEAFERVALMEQGQTEEFRTEIPVAVRRPIDLTVATRRPARGGSLLGTTTSASALSGARLKIIRGLAELEAVGVSKARRAQLSFYIGISFAGGYGSNTLGTLRTGGLVDYPDDGYVALTPTGRAAAGEVDPPESLRELHDRIRGHLSGLSERIFDAIVALGAGGATTREKLGSIIGVSFAAGYGSNTLGALRTAGIVDYPDKGTVGPSDLLFPDGLL